MSVLLHHFEHVSIGLHIEAVPFLGEKRTDGAVFIFGDVPTWEADVGFYPALVEVPAALSSSIDPDSATLELSALQCGIAATAEACELLMQYPQPRGWIGTDDGTGSFAGDVGPGDGTLTVTTSSTISVGGYLWVGDECMYVDAAAELEGVWTLTVTRAIAASPAQSHPAGKRVYLECPLHLLAPVVTLYLYDHATQQTLEPIWSGLLNTIDTDDDQNTIVVRGDALLQPLVDLSLGLGTPRLSAQSVRVHGPNGIADGGVRGTVLTVGDVEDSEWVCPASPTKILRIGDFVGDFNLSAGELSAAGTWILGQRIPPDATVGALVEGTPREVLAMNRVRDEVVSGISHNPFLGLTGDRHFAAVALALLLSTGRGTNNPAFGTFDVLGRPWGCGLPARLIDEESWAAAISSEADQIDQLYLEGPFDVWPTVRELLSGHGAFFAFTHSGKLAIRRLESLRPETLGELMTARHWTVLEEQRIQLQRGDVRPNVRAEIGGLDLPTHEPDTVSLTPLVGTRRDSRTYKQSPTTFRMPWRYASPTGRDATLNFLSTSAVRRLEGSPHLRCNVPFRHFSRQLQPDDGTVRVLPGLGEWLRLRAPSELLDGTSELEVIGPDGTRVDINATNITFVGRAVAYTLYLDSGVVEATIALENWTSGDRFPRLVAPAHRLLSYDSETNWSVIDTAWLSANGASEFAAGDQVEVVLSGGKRWLGDPGDLEVDDVDDDGPEYRVQLSDDVDLPSYPVYLRLAHADRYNNPSWDGAEWYDAELGARRWAYVAGTDLLVGTVAPVDADVWSG